MRVNITLACTECGDRNYISKKNKRNNPDRLELKKYCSREKRQLHTVKQSKQQGFLLLFFLCRKMVGAMKSSTIRI